MLSMFIALPSYANDVSDKEECIKFNDKDKYGIPNDVNNCPKTHNPAQDDSDRDGIGDV